MRIPFLALIVALTFSISLASEGPFPSDFYSTGERILELEPKETTEKLKKELKEYEEGNRNRSLLIGLFWKEKKLQHHIETLYLEDKEVYRDWMVAFSSPERLKSICEEDPYVDWIETEVGTNVLNGLTEYLIKKEKTLSFQIKEALFNEELDKTYVHYRTEHLHSLKEGILIIIKKDDSWWVLADQFTEILIR